MIGKRLTAGLATVVALAAVSTVLLLANEPEEAHGASVRELKTAASKITAVPGLRTDPPGAVLDEMIAYYQGWERDKQVSQCMREAGFEWRPEVSFPEEDLLEIAAVIGDFGVGRRPDSAARAAADSNQEYVDSLADSMVDQYYTALTGASEEQQYSDESWLNEEGESHESKSAGCLGDALADWKGIWGGVEDVNVFWPEYLARADLSDYVKGKADAFEKCASPFTSERVRSEADWDAIDDHDARIGIQKQCMDSLSDLRQARNEIASGIAWVVNEEALLRQIERYTGMETIIAADEEFVEFLMQEAGAALQRVESNASR